MVQAHILIKGRVQGVGFRQYIRSQARRLGITGWAQNTDDGKVEAVLQGRIEDIKVLIELCRRGPFVAHVEDLSVNWEEEEPELHMDSFEIQ